MYAASPEWEGIQLSVAPHVDVDEVLDLLRVLSDAASLSPRYIELFWRKLEFDTTIILLQQSAAYLADYLHPANLGFFWHCPRLLAHTRRR